MRRICGLCGKDLGWKEGPAGQVTHGICPLCIEEALRERGTFACDPTARDSRGYPMERDQLD